jgi:hypothetical protein
MDSSDMPTAAPAANQTAGAMPKTEALQSCGVRLKTKDGMVDMEAVQKIAHK